MLRVTTANSIYTIAGATGRNGEALGEGLFRHVLDGRPNTLPEFELSGQYIGPVAPGTVRIEPLCDGEPLVLRLAFYDVTGEPRVLRTSPIVRVDYR